MSNNIEKDENLTVSRVYETLKSPTFLKNLYWDILSGIKEKNTYKLMREIAEGVIDQNMEVLEKLNSNNEEDNIRRKAIVAEISVMSYTIDKVFSKILYMKLEKVCKEQIVKIIQELKDEGKIPENVWSKFKMNHPDIAGFQTSTTENKVDKTKPLQQKKVVQVAPTRVGSRRRKVNSNYTVVEDNKKANSNDEILDDLKKVNGEKYSEEDSNSKKGNIQKRNLEGKVKEFQNENIPSPGASSSSIKLETHSVNQVDSDAESEISLGRISPVSSVHTSDLSSFEDVISLSSDDENGEKKTVPLKEALKKYSETDHSNFSTDIKPDINLLKSPEPKVSMNDAGKSISQAGSNKSPSENELPKRARKPNSRYSSMHCPAVRVKERKKPVNLKTYGKECKDQFSPEKKKVKLDDDDIYVDVVTITQSVNEGKSNNDLETPAKQETPDSFKSHSANRSLTSRRTAPVTLFST